MWIVSAFTGNSGGALRGVQAEVWSEGRGRVWSGHDVWSRRLPGAMKMKWAPCFGGMCS